MEALGYLLIAAAVVLFLVEALVPTGGLIGLIGIGALVAGGILLDVPVAVIALLVVAIVAVGALFSWKVWKAQKQERVLTGWEELMGAEGDVRVALAPVGQVFIQGALWRARVTGEGNQVPVGERVRVRDVDGLTLVVEPL
jgi:membrane-bound serine protease (ClpP class)